MNTLKYIIVLIALSANKLAYSQHTITGKIVSEKDEPLSGATLVLLDGIDSTLISFALTDDLGRFRIPDVEVDSNILQASFISFESYSERLYTENKKGEIKIGIVRLSESREVLKEVTISAEHIPMGIRGDTISYNAAAFKTRPNASVEDLLKKLPGIEVERSGNIKAQGKDVENVLVDGKEFFGGDPTMATKNLQAEAVNEVEVYDKKSEIAEFTGVDDGNEEKTINLKLKEDHKNGGFGNADFAGGTDDRYETGISYFRFSPRLQASAIIASNNINEETFSFEDQIEFMGGIAAAMSSGGLNFINYAGLEDGINNSTSVGGNFNYEISEKLSLRSNYLFNRLENTNDQWQNTEGVTDNFRYSNLDTLQSNKGNAGHQLNTKLSYSVNPLTEFVFQNNIDLKNRNITRKEFSQYFKASESLGFSNAQFKSATDSWGIDSKTWFKQKFRKKGRSLISTVTYLSDQTTKLDFVNNMNRVGSAPFDVMQNQTYDNRLHQFGFDLNVTEPISDKIFLGAKYAYGRSEEKPERLFYDIENGAEDLNETLSSEYEKLYLFQRTGFNIRRNTKSLKMNMALEAQFTSLDGIINDSESSIEGSFVNLLPAFSLDYELKGGKGLTFNYSTAITAPTLDQLMPLQDNTRPNFIYIGNPGLDPQYDHRLGLGFHLFDNFSFTSLFVNVNSNLSMNRIVYQTNINEELFQTVTPINTDTYRELSSYLSFSRPFRPLKLKYRLRGRLRLSRYQSFINNTASDVTDNNFNIRFSMSNRKTDHVLVEAGVLFDISKREYGVAPDFNQSYNNQTYFLLNEFYFLNGWTLTSDIEYSKYSSSGFAAAPDFYLWKASVRKLLFDNKLEFKVSVHDILNQNLGYRRSGDIQSIQEVEYTTLGRFFLLGVNYKIGKGKSNNGMRIEMD